MQREDIVLSRSLRWALLPSGCLVFLGALIFIFEPHAVAASGGGGFGQILDTSTLAQNVPAVRAPVVTPNPASTILPTDVLPLPQVQNRLSFAENLQLRILQRLPSRFYFTSSTEVTGRYETNPFQFPTKRRLERELQPSLSQINQLSVLSQQQLRHELSLPGSSQAIFRILPNVTAGFTLTPHTRVFGNYFMIHDSLQQSTRLNTVINSIAYGVQQDIPLGSRANLQAEIQFRELYQSHGKGSSRNGSILDTRRNFDYLPGLTLSYVVTPRTVAFINALIQIRGKEYFQAPTREFDPFYTWGMLHQRGGWSFSASTTFVQNFREQFPYATIRQNNYSFISDFEVARRLFRQVPGLQAFVRAEPIWNFHSRYRPGLSGMDFRLFYGMRLALTKPSLTAGLEQLKQQIEEQEGEPSKPPGSTNKPSAFLQPYQVVAAAQQPIHGFIFATPTQGQSDHLVLTHGTGEDSSRVADLADEGEMSIKTVLPGTANSAPHLEASTPPTASTHSGVPAEMEATAQELGRLRLDSSVQELSEQSIAHLADQIAQQPAKKLAKRLGTQQSTGAGITPDADIRMEIRQPAPGIATTNAPEHMDLRPLIPESNASAIERAAWLHLRAPNDTSMPEDPGNHPVVFMRM